MKRNMLKVVAASLAGAMLLTACGGGSSSSSQTTAAAGNSAETSAAAEAGSTGGEKVITMAQTGDWDTFMPMNTTNSGADNVIELMFDRLMVINTDGTFEPRLADSWETNEAQDKITYHLNENAKWQDGEPVTAEDVVYSAQVASSSEYNYLRRIRMKYFAGTDETGCETSTDSIEVAALDDHTVEFTLKDPMDPAIIYALVNRDFFIMPKHLLDSISDADLVNDAFWQKPIGSGPCIFDSMESGVSIEFKANKDYYLGAPDFDRLVFKKVQSSNLLSGLMSGDIDVLSGNSQIPLADWETAKNTQGIVTKSVPTFAYQYMAMNTARDYLTEDVRHAISLAINRQVIVDQLLQGEARIAIGPLAEDHPYFDEKLLPIEYDPEKAKEMQDLIYKIKGEGDTIGGVLTCVIKGCPIGLGQPVYGKLHAALGNAMLSINAAKAFEYGDGFKGLKQKGSEQNDVFYNNNGRIETRTNHSGGIQGGISNGQDIFFRVAFKPVATVLMEQETVNIDGIDTTLKARGRHDPCVLPRAVPIVEAMAAMTILDYYLLDRMTQL